MAFDTRLDYRGGDDGRDRGDVRDVEMKLVISNKSLRWASAWMQRTLFAAGILLLGYVGFVMADTWIFQARESAALEQFVPPRHAAVGPPAVGSDGLIGRMEVARLGVSVMVIEGTSNKTLRRAVGHIAGTPLPGQTGNVGIAGHRDGFFRPLRNIKPDDIITLTTLRGEYRYRVVSIKIVSPDNVAVLDSDASEVLTLVTCYPFYYVGSAPDRFIVRAARVM
jgi:sortase A